MLKSGGMDAGRKAAPEMLEAAVSMTRSELMRAREEESGGRGGKCAAWWRRAPLGAQARERRRRGEGVTASHLAWRLEAQPLKP